MIQLDELDIKLQEVARRRKIERKREGRSLEAVGAAFRVVQLIKAG